MLARARLLSRLSPAIEEELLLSPSREGDSDALLCSDQRALCDVACAAAAVLSELEKLERESKTKSASMSSMSSMSSSSSRSSSSSSTGNEGEEEEDNELALWSMGDAAADDATARKGNGDGRGGEEQKAEDDGEDLALFSTSARSLFASAAAAAAPLPLQPPALARLGRALVDSGELQRLADDARSGGLDNSGGGASGALFDAVARGAAALGKGGVSPSSSFSAGDHLPLRPADVLNLAWVMGKAVEASRRAAANSSADAVSTMTGRRLSSPSAVATRAALAAAGASALGALASSAIVDAAPRADAAAVASAAWALAIARSADDDGVTGSSSSSSSSASFSSSSSLALPAPPAAATARALDALAARCAELAPTAPARWTAATLWALARARHRHAPAFEAAAAALDDKEDENSSSSFRPLAPAVAATLALAFARAGAFTSENCRLFLDGIAADAQELADATTSNNSSSSSSHSSPSAVLDARAAANLAFGLAAAGRLPARLHSSLATIVAFAGEAGGASKAATAAELGQIHVAGVAVRARGALTAPAASSLATKKPSPPPPPPPVDFDSFMRSLFDAGRAERAAAACWGAGAPLGAAKVTRSQSEMVSAVSSLLLPASTSAAPSASRKKQRREKPPPPCHPSLVPEHRAAGLAAVDAALPASKVAIEFDGPSHFFANAPSSPVGGTRFKRALLKSQGWTVVSIPHTHWSQLSSDAQRNAYAAVALGRHSAARAALSPAAVAATRAALGGGRGRGGDAEAAPAAKPPSSSSSSSSRLADALWQSFEAMREEYELVQGEGDDGGEARTARGNGAAGGREVEKKSLPPQPRPPPPPPPAAATEEQMAKRLAALRIRQGRLGVGKGGGSSAASAALAIRKAAAVAAAAAAAAEEKRRAENNEEEAADTSTTNPE